MRTRALWPVEEAAPCRDCGAAAGQACRTASGAVFHVVHAGRTTPTSGPARSLRAVTTIASADDPMPDPPQASTGDVHPATAAVLRYFAFEHLRPGPLRDTSEQCANLALRMVAALPPGPELTVGLRKLLEAKDAFVRSALDLR